MSRDAALAAFASLKADFLEGRFPAASGRLAGEALAWGTELLALFRQGGRQELDGVDVLSRFWVLRFRGMPQPADLGGAGPGPAFVLAFTAFPYLDVMMESWELGQVVEEGEGRLVFSVLFDGEDQGTRLAASRAQGRWNFDLMGLYRDKATALEAFIELEFGAFDVFFEHYVAEHDLAFDMEQAWRPLEGA